MQRPWGRRLPATFEEQQGSHCGRSGGMRGKGPEKGQEGARQGDVCPEGLLPSEMEPLGVGREAEPAEAQMLTRSLP